MRIICSSQTTNGNCVLFACMIRHTALYFVIFYLSFCYAPNFEKVDGAYCFWSVRACVRAWVRACVTLFVPTVTFKPLKLES